MSVQPFSLADAMAYRLLAEQSLEENLQRILQEQLEAALYQLTENFDQQPASAIYTARKHLKKTRSLLQLVRRSLNRDTYRCEKNTLRDAGRSLAAARDGGAYRATLEDLLEVYKSTLNVKTFANLQQSLAELQQLRLQQLTAHHAPIIAVVADLKQSQIRLSNLTFAATGWEALGENLHQIYRRGRAQFKTVRKKGRDEDFHEWRKRVKDLWYGTRLLKDLWFPVMNAYDSEAHGLSKLLGTDRDIAELRQFLHHPTTEIKLKKANTKVLTPLMGHRQYQLQQQALALGQKLYAEKPTAFSDRVGQYGHSWMT
ncbi:MAG: CHAD domain-containing protein [Cyanobacteria bacterium P01_H01_bin.162]